MIEASGGKRDTENCGVGILYRGRGGVGVFPRSVATHLYLVFVALMARLLWPVGHSTHSCFGFCRSGLDFFSFFNLNKSDLDPDSDPDPMGRLQGKLLVFHELC